METLTGTVKRVSPVTKNRVQFEFKESNKYFELSIDQAWVVGVGDEVRVSGFQDITGKFCAYAYTNTTKSVEGWKYPNYLGILLDLGFSFICFSFYFLLASPFVRSNTSGVIVVLVGLCGVYLYMNQAVKKLLTYRQSRLAACS